MANGNDGGLSLPARIMRFGAVGIAATAVHTVIGLGLHYGLGMAAFWANVIAFSCAVVVSFTGQTRLAFPEAEANRAAFAKFIVVAVTGLLMNQLIVWIFASQGWPYWLALCVIYVTVPAGTFVALRFWALR